MRGGGVKVSTLNWGVTLAKVAQFVYALPLPSNTPRQKGDLV